MNGVGQREGEEGYTKRKLLRSEQVSYRNLTRKGTPQEPVPRLKVKSIRTEPYPNPTSLVS